MIIILSVRLFLSVGGIVNRNKELGRIFVIFVFFLLWVEFDVELFVVALLDVVDVCGLLVVVLIGLFCVLRWIILFDFFLKIWDLDGILEVGIFEDLFRFLRFFLENKGVYLFLSEEDNYGFVFLFLDFWLKFFEFGLELWFWLRDDKFYFR